MYAEHTMWGFTHVFTALLLVAAVWNLVSAEVCPTENCIEATKCESVVTGAVSCPNKSKICCSVVKSEFRDHCRHHGGECMDSCSLVLQRQVVDCVGGTTCCVLV